MRIGVCINVGDEPPSAQRPDSELERFFDLTLDLLAIAGFDGYLKRVNQAYARTHGYAIEELLARPMLDVVHPDDRDSVREALAGMLHGNDVAGFENRVICADGSVRWLEWNTRAVPDRGIVYGVGRDVTDRRRADAELRDAHRMIEAGCDQLTASGARLLTASDDARRRVVRDLHDGAQQRLVHTIVTLKLAQRSLRGGDADTESLLAEALEHAERGNAELRELAHGILPAVLTRGGLRAGIDAVVARLDLPVRVDVPVRRFPAEIEANAYFIVAEALNNVVKHSHAENAAVRASVQDEVLHVEVRDDGIGGTDPGGHGILGMGDRATARGGRLTVESPAGGGTLVAAALPLSVV
jgi:PAS domain S-box-containing protein